MNDPYELRAECEREIDRFDRLIETERWPELREYQVIRRRFWAMLASRHHATIEREEERDAHS